MLKTLSIKSAKPRNGVIDVGGDIKARCDGSMIFDNEVDDEVNNEFDDEVEKKSQNPSKFKNSSKSKKTELGFLTSGARMVFIKLR